MSLSISLLSSDLEKVERKHVRHIIRGTTMCFPTLFDQCTLHHRHIQSHTPASLPATRCTQFTSIPTTPYQTHLHTYYIHTPTIPPPPPDSRSSVCTAGLTLCSSPFSWPTLTWSPQHWTSAGAIQDRTNYNSNEAHHCSNEAHHGSIEHTSELS